MPYSLDFETASVLSRRYSNYVNVSVRNGLTEYQHGNMVNALIAFCWMQMLSDFKHLLNEKGLPVVLALNLAVLWG